ncbi:hypothetical protein BaRGS_00037685 [Batillaria attramentaria]|uniref:Uncharacterized protein n=1 Tax=Batillaria attramentaria TaxID=370345 RepID=A0ABD0J841_9CAEN
MAEVPRGRLSVMSEESRPYDDINVFPDAGPNMELASLQSDQGPENYEIPRLPNSDESHSAFSPYEALHRIYGNFRSWKERVSRRLSRE